VIKTLKLNQTDHKNTQKVIRPDQRYVQVDLHSSNRQLKIEEDNVSADTYAQLLIV
jgi:hypothetical protein